MKKWMWGGILGVSAMCVVWGSLTGQSARDARRENQVKNSEKEEQSFTVVTTQKERLQKGASCITILYDVTNGKSQEIQGIIRESFIDWNREEIISYLNMYMEHMPADEQEKGLLSYELLAFSGNQMVVKKSYRETEEDFCFIGVLNHEVVIYYGAEKEEYEGTGIDARTLSVQEQKKLSCGIKVKSEEELYGILEDYSS